MSIVLPTQRIAHSTSRGPRYDSGVACGPLAALLIDGEWHVIHRASGHRVGATWQSATAALLFAGALLNLPVNWEATDPELPAALRIAAQRRIEEALT